MNLKNLRNPDLYHGRLGKNYFEGWYFKLVGNQRKHAFAFIPGVFFSPGGQHDHGFIQVVDGMKRAYQYECFAVDDFSAARDIFSVNVGGSSFGRSGLDFNLLGEEAKVKGRVDFSNHLDWPDNFLNPGSMGFYNYLPKMQCYAQVCAMDIDLDGSLEINGQFVDFKGGKGYIEKNWGSAFPYSWIWVQGNSFLKEHASLSCSLAHIPFPVSSFRGFLVGLYVGDSFYEFTTMNRSKAEVIQKGTDLVIHLKNRHHRLTIDCETNSEDFILLNGPRGDQMVPLVQENLQGKVTVILRENAGGKIIYEDISLCAGVEYGGEQMMVLG
ncbi:MAG: tocopherol cyclase family protein [Bacillota bacterium]